MAFEVVDRQQRLVPGHRQRLGGDQPDHHSTDQPRPRGRRNGVHVGKVQPRIGERCGDQRGDLLDMRARRDFGHYPAVGAVRFVLRGDVLGQDPAFEGGRGAIDDRRRGLVAARFYPEDQRHCPLSLNGIGL